MPARLLCSQAAKEPEEQSAAGETLGEEEKAEAPSWPLVLFRAPGLSQDHDDAEKMVNQSAFGSAFGLSVALLGIAPFTAPNTFMIAMMLAAVQVRLAHTWQTRMLRSQVRRNVEEIVQLDEDRISVRNGNGCLRTLHLSSDAASGERPPLSEVMGLSDPWVFIDRGLGTVEAPEALEAMLQSDRAIEKEELDVKTFEDEPQSEADQVVQSLAKITSKELAALAKGAPGWSKNSPKASIKQVSMSASTVAGVILVSGGVICVVGRREADAPVPGGVIVQ